MHCHEVQRQCTKVRIIQLEKRRLGVQQSCILDTQELKRQWASHYIFRSIQHQQGMAHVAVRPPMNCYALLSRTCVTCAKVSRLRSNFNQHIQFTNERTRSRHMASIIKLISDLSTCITKTKSIKFRVPHDQ